MSHRTRRGLSLAEVLVIVVIVVVVLAMLIPAVRRVRYSSSRMQCSNNLKQLIIAVQNYEDSGRPVAEPTTIPPDAPTAKRFPPGCIGTGNTPDDRLSWVVAVLPYMDHVSLFRQFDPKLGYTGHPVATRTGIKSFLCPEANQPLSDATTHYIAMAGIGADAAARPAGADGIGFMGYDRTTTIAAIRDGTSNTIALMETRSALGPWARGGTSTVRGFDPADVPWCGDGRPFGGHHGGTQVAFADGSVRFIRAAIEPKPLAAAITIAGGEKFDLD